MADSCPHCGAPLPALRDAFCSECHNDLDEVPLRTYLPSRPEGRRAVDGTPKVAVGYATEARLYRWMRFSWYDDWGLIDPTPEGFRFAGRKGTLRMSRISDIQFTCLVIPWANVVSLTLGNVLILLAAGAGAFTHLTLDNPVIYLVLAFIDVFALCAWPMNWVRIDYLDQQDRPCRAYFIAKSPLDRWTGGGQRLRALLRPPPPAEE